MKRSNRLVILVGVLLAVLAFVGIVVMLNEQPSAEQLGPRMETVVVATEDIAIGEPVTPERVETREVQADAVIQTPLRDVSQVQGQPALFALPAGSQVTEAAIGLGVGAQNIAAQLEPGEKAIAFVVDRVQGVEFLVQAGDTVDIIAAVHLPSESESVTRTVKTVLQNKRVLYVSGTNIAPPAPAEPTPEGEEPAPAPAAISSVVIVFAGSDQDAEVIRMAQRTETDRGDGVPSALSVTLRSNDDEEIEETTGVNLEILVSDYGLLVPDLEDILPNDEDDTETEPAP